MKFLKVFDLSIGSLRISGVSKSIVYSFDSTNGGRLPVPNLPDLTVAALPHFKKRFIEFKKSRIDNRPVLVHYDLQ